jgi:hypothetical protein
MEGLPCCGAARSGTLDLPDIRYQKPSTRLNGLSLSAEKNSKITIVTDEGDTVLLSTGERSTTAVLTYEHLSGTHHGFIREEMQLLDFETARELTLAVQGDLNDQEIADIQALLKELGGMLKAFLTGSDAGGTTLEAARALDRFETISAFKADFEYRTSLHYLNIEADPPIARKPVCPERVAPVGEEAAIAPTIGFSPASVLAVAGRDQPAVELEVPSVETERVAARMARRVHASGLSGNRRMKHLEKFLKNILKEMLANPVIDNEQAQRGQRVIATFMNELPKPADAVEVLMSRVALKLQRVSRGYEVTMQANLKPAVVEAA